MNRIPLIFGLLLFVPTAISAQIPPLDLKTQEHRLQIQKMLTETEIDRMKTREMKLKEALSLLEKQLPQGSRFPIQLDEKAFGKNYSQMAEITIDFPTIYHQNMASILDELFRRPIQGQELDYAILPDRVVITTPQLAANWIRYDIRDILPEMTRIFPDLLLYTGKVDTDLKNPNPSELFVRYLSNEIDFQSWEKIEIHGSYLEIFASSSRQMQLAKELTFIRQQSAYRVRMNARIYEVDRTYYEIHMAPKFASQKDSPNSKKIVVMEPEWWNEISKDKPLVESDLIQLKTNQSSLFLSKQSTFRFKGDPHPNHDYKQIVGTGLEGVNFEVHPRVLSYGKSLHLSITQHSTQLLGIDRVKKRNETTEKEMEIEKPKILQTTSSGTIQIQDGKPILMPIDYRPSEKDKQEKVWLLVARPMIWIPSEIDELKKLGVDISSNLLWERPFAENEVVFWEKSLQTNDQIKEILQAVITDLLTDPEMKHICDRYGTAEDKTFVLMSGKFEWPKDFRPKTWGYKLIEIPRKVDPNQRRVFGIHLNGFDLKGIATRNRIRKQEIADGVEVIGGDSTIEVCIGNAFGSANRGVVGGCFLYYKVTFANNCWSAECCGGVDP